ncbi:MAG: hypothetical protein DRQ02_01430 [Candidatus Latescibacterota bacterium]|nr:MAG: hypothetical protein DRQ02_01430 [Candidatus Latescibacterota bacterium]
MTTDDGREIDGSFAKGHKGHGRRGMRTTLGTNLTSADYKALATIREGVRLNWRTFYQHYSTEDFKNHIDVLVKIGGDTTNKNTAIKAIELLWRYGLGREAPGSQEKQERIHVILQQLFQQQNIILRPEEIEAIESAGSRDWLPAPSRTATDSSAPIETETGVGRGESGEESV